MSPPSPDDPWLDLRLLGLAPGSPLAALKPAWRRAVSALHPDRAGPEAAARLAEVNAAFRRLEDYAQREGRLPGPGPTGGRSPRAGGKRARLAVAAVLLLVVVGVLLWAEGPVEGAAPTNGSEDAVMPHDVASAPLGGRGERLAVGSPADDVLRLLGRPTFEDGEDWHYGPSVVRFRDGKVIGWHNSPLQPLPVAIEAGADVSP